MRYAVKKDSVKIIFLNEEMFDDSKIKEKFRFKILFQPNGFDEEIFFNFRKSKNNDDKKTIIFAGNLSRFNEDRGLDTLLKAFMSKSFRDKYNLKIIGGPDKVKDSISTFVLNNSLNNSITITGRVSRNEAIKQMINSDIGILTNSDKNQHSFRHTSPLKYFEYLYAGLKVVALDFPSHKKLPFSKNISFYKVGDVDSFKLAILKSSKSRIIPPEELLEYSLDRRVKNILKFIS
jgi:glycosyltransferase involved in cell wall biosynthesis